MNKLKAYGIQGNIYTWIQKFLSNRKQRVSVRGFYSDWTNVLSVVPQDSVLGPTLFIIYVNDLPGNILSSLGLFADDTKIYRPIFSPADIDMLQQDLNSLVEWCGTWLSFLNFSKCKHMSICPKSTSTTPKQYYFNLDDEVHQILTVQEQKDLGDTFDENLHFKTHVNQIICRANNVLGTIKRTFNSRDPNLIRQLYTTLVRPTLDYASTIWNPHQMGNIRGLEKVQRRAIKLIPTFRNLSYPERLQILNLPSLSYRRNRMDLIMAYKILNDLVVEDKDYFFTINTSCITRTNGLKIFKEFNKSTIRRVFFHRG